MKRIYYMFAALLCLLFLPVCGTDFLYEMPNKQGDNRPDGPASIVASDGTEMGKVIITWNAVSNADNYMVYRSDLTNGAYLLIGTNITATTFEDSSVSGTGAYYYRVSFCDINSNESKMSSYEEGHAALYKPPAVVSVQASETHSDRVDVTWGAASSAVSYTLYRASSETGPYTAVASDLTNTSCSDSNAQFGVGYYYRVVYRDVKNRLSILSGADQGALGFSSGVPIGVNATDGAATDRITVTWSPTNNAIAYRVYRATTADGGYQRVGGDVAAPSTSYQDNSVLRNCFYYYRVSAVQADGKESGLSAAADSGFAWGSKPVVAASDGTYSNQIALSWSQEPWVASWRVYRATAAAGSYALIATVNSNGYADTSAATGTHYFYKVEALTTNGQVGTRSECDEGYASFADAPGMPQNVQGGEKTLWSVKVSWNAVAGAYRYRVYWSDTIDGVYTVVKNDESSTSYSKAVLDDQKFYRISAYNSAGHEGPLSPPADAFSTSYPGSPYNVQATDGTLGGKVRISWSLPSSGGSSRVYRSDWPGGSYIDISGKFSGTSYEDSSVKKGPYYYRVTAETLLYTSSHSLADVGWAQPVALPAVPGGVAASDGTDAAAIKITWQAAADASYYKVYRSATEDGTYIAVSGNLADPAAGYDDNDSSLLAGKLYYYKVAAFNSMDKQSGLSGADSGTLKTASVDAPQVVLASDGTLENKISVIWTPVPGASYYRVYRAESSDGIYLSVGDKVTATAYFDQNVAAIPYYYKVAAFDSLGRGSSLSPSDSGSSKPVPVPDTPGDIIATDGTYTNRVAVTWAPADGAVYYKLARSTKVDGPYNYVSGNIVGTSYEDTNVPPGPYYYKVSAFNDENRTGPLSKYDCGHIKLSDFAFFMEYEKTIARSHQKLTLMHKGGTSALGKEFKYGDIDGQVLYDAHVKGAGGEVFISYNQYCDYYMVLNGRQRTLANMSENGTMDGKVDITSPVYNGYVRYQITITSGADSGGKWYVSQDGNAETEIPWFAH